MLRTVFNTILKVSGWISALLIAYIALAITVEVVLRYLFNATIIWINDFVEYSILWATFLGAAYVLKEERHIEMDFFISGLHRKARVVSKIVTSFIGFAISALLAVFSGITTIDNYIRGVRIIRTIEVPKFMVLIPVFIGCVLLTIQFAIRMMDYRRRIGEEPEKMAQPEYDL